MTHNLRFMAAVLLSMLSICVAFSSFPTTMRSFGTRYSSLSSSRLIISYSTSSSLSASSSTNTLEKGPPVLDRPQTLERSVTKTDEPKKQRKGAGHEAWEVRIYNDGLNTREHVARSLVQVTGMSEMSAYQTMMQAHQFGIAVVGRWPYEVAEMYYDALRKNGIVCDIVPVDEE